MKVIHKSYKFEFRPTQEQKALLNKHFGHTRFVYNHFLAQRIKQYKEYKKSDNYCAQAVALTSLKKEKDTLWLSEVSTQALQASLKCHGDVLLQIANED